MNKKTNEIKLSKEQAEVATDKIKAYLTEDLGLEISIFQTKLLIDFLNNNIGKYYYNEAIKDSIYFINQKTEDMYALMKDE